MRAKLRHFALNCLASLLSLAACLTILELVVFRHFLVPDDVLANVTINGVVRYQPNSTAVFRHPDGRTSTATINADGWNSTKPRYERNHPPGKVRIAVVGDSYVHGAFIDSAKGFPEVLERTLQSRGTPAEVLRFGMDGAPLSQYLHMLRREVIAYAPDVVVIPLIHNDFDESWRFLATRYASSFMKIDTDAPGGPAELLPADFKPGVADLLRQFATFRYLYYKTNAYLRLKAFVSRYFWGGNEDWNRAYIQSAVDIRKIADDRRNRIAARHVLWGMKRLAARHGFKLLFVMDGVREAVYDAKPQSAYAVGKLNALAADLTTELDLPFVDLYELFRSDWQAHHRRFEFAYDWHWNERANRLVGEEIARVLQPTLNPLAKQAATPATGRKPATKAGG
ncbi:MAG: GDSL-type esterase/lipase family protein [Hyphomicrobiaceae bacterium]